MSKIQPCLWYNGDAEEAAKFYVSLLPDSRIDRIVKAPADNPSTKEGSVLVVEFTLAGEQYVGLNGGPQFQFTEAISLQVLTDDQAETDRLWNAVLANGGEAVACGWIKDRWGLCWQISPRRLLELIGDADRGRARRAFEAMMDMIKIDIAKIEQAANAVEPVA